MDNIVGRKRIRISLCDFTACYNPYNVKAFELSANYENSPNLIEAEYVHTYHLHIQKQISDFRDIINFK